MKKLIYIILITVMFQSCLTIRKIERNCDKFAKICITEKETTTVYRDTIIYRTDTIRVPLPRDTVKITDTVRIANNLAYLPTVYKEFGLIGVKAGVHRSILNVNAYLTDSTILVPRNDTILLEKVIKEKSEKEMVPVKYIPGFYRFTFWFFIALIMFGLIVVVKKFKK